MSSDVIFYYENLTSLANSTYLTPVLDVGRGEGSDTLDFSVQDFKSS